MGKAKIIWERVGMLEDYAAPLDVSGSGAIVHIDA
jgi:hypothetical protein